MAVDIAIFGGSTHWSFGNLWNAGDAPTGAAFGLKDHLLMSRLPHAGSSGSKGSAEALRDVALRLPVLTGQSGKMVGIMSWEKLGKEVRARRTELGLTQTELADRGGPSVETLRTVENNRAGRLSARMRRALERVLHMTVTAKPLLLDSIALGSETWMQPTFAMSDKGRDAVSAQLNAAMANCQKSNLLAPPGCPVHLDPHGLAEGTVTWGTADVSAIKLDNFEPYGLVLLFFGEVKVPITVKSTGGATKQGIATQFLSGNADMAKAPPELNFR
jgi:transcriptional regulator with XRE-family HTH domain